MIQRTSVRRIREGQWRVTYYWPYSGVMDGDYTSWREAFNRALLIEDERQYL